MEPFSINAVFPHPDEPIKAMVYFGRERGLAGAGFICSIPRPGEGLGDLRSALARPSVNRPRELLPVPELEPAPLPPPDSDIERWRSFSGADE